MSEVVDTALIHLRAQFQRGRAILFTGAGFSVTARNLDGELLPMGRSLAETIWRLCFPSNPFDEAASLQDVYEAALGKDPKGLKDLLTRKLTVDPQSIDERIARYFSFPWHRIYTLNIDNLPDAVSRRFELQRPIVEISAMNPSSRRSARNGSHSGLPVYYLNGNLSDAPDNVTFAGSHYAKRLASPDSLYLELVSDIVSRPVVFVGTGLHEPPLWQNVEIRKAKGSRDMRELRPRSYLVTPNLDRARQARLSEFNITWIQMTAEEFSMEVLQNLADTIEIGLKVFKTANTESNKPLDLPEVGELATNPQRQSEFLLGQEPIWADIQSDRAVQRVCDTEFWETFKSVLSTSDQQRIVLLTGTAGSGKSTCLMRLALRAAAHGHHVGWIDRDNELSPRDIISAMKGDSYPSVLAIDDADLFGTSLSSMLLDILSADNSPVVLIALRSGVVDRVIDSVVLRGLHIKELTVPHLTDADIDSLIETLDRENRLGFLKGKTREQQRGIFSGYAGRQLLVAMISATSGSKLQEKVPGEFFDLPANMQRVYAVVALATTFRYRVSRQEILLALNDSTNEALNEIETLIRRHILVEIPPGSGQIQARHRVIAEMMREELLRRGQISEAIFGLAFMAATYKRSGVPRKHRALRLLRSITNHDFLYRNLERDRSQLLYQQLETLLSDDAHYWLQRGSLEVEFGDLRLAENFLSQARGLSRGDLYIDNEWAYLLFKKALGNPRGSAAPEYICEATELIESIIRDPKASPYPFHVLGSQGLVWSRMGISVGDEKAKYLRGIKSVVEKGISRYPSSKELRQLRDDLQREYLSLALSPSKQ